MLLLQVANNEIKQDCKGGEKKVILLVSMSMSIWVNSSPNYKIKIY